MTFRTKNAKERSNKYALTTGAGKTKQEFKRESDINHIIARFKKTRVLPQVNASVKQYLDTTNIRTEYDDRMLFLKEVEQSFMAQPSDIRKQFGHDAGAWLQGVQDALLAQEAEELAKANATPSPEPPVEPSEGV